MIGSSHKLLLKTVLKRTTNMQGNMQKITFYLFLFLSLVIVGCVQKKLSSEELIAAFIAAGYRVEKEGRIHHSLEGAQKAMWIKIDDTRIAAYQYSTIAKTKLRAKTFRGGTNAGFWAFEFADAQTAEKIKKALE